MKNAGHEEAIKKGTFLMVCSGESYSAEIIKGSEITEKLFEALFGGVSEGEHEEREFYRNEIDEPDNWNHDLDLGPTYWDSEIGETDRVRIYLITDKKLKDKDEALRHAKQALSWSKPVGGDSCNGAVSEAQAFQWHETANEKIDEAL